MRTYIWVKTDEGINWVTYTLYPIELKFRKEYGKRGKR